MTPLLLKTRFSPTVFASDLQAKPLKQSHVDFIVAFMVTQGYPRMFGEKSFFEKISDIVEEILAENDK